MGTTTTTNHGFIKPDDDEPGDNWPTQWGSTADDIDDAIPVAGQFPNEVIKRTRSKTASSNITDTEVVLLSVTGTLVNLHTYLAKCYFTLEGGAGAVIGTRFNVRIREDDINGSTVQSGNVILDTTSNLGQQFILEGEYDAIASGSKTFVFTVVRQTEIGNGTVTMKGAVGFWPNRFSIQHVGLTASL